MLGSTQTHPSGTICVSLCSHVNRIGPETKLFAIGKMRLLNVVYCYCLLAKMADSQYRVGHGVEWKSFKYNRFPRNMHAYVWCQDKIITF